MTISIYDVETVHQLSCAGSSCFATICEDSAEKVVETANSDGWVERDFGEHYHGILCGGCDADYSD